MDLKIPGQRVHHTYRTAEGVEMTVYAPQPKWVRALSVLAVPFAAVAILSAVLLYGLLALVVWPVREKLAGR